MLDKNSYKKEVRMNLRKIEFFEKIFEKKEKRLITKVCQ